METPIQFVVLLLVVPAIFAVIDYCAIDKCPNGSHTLCKYKQTGLVRRCGVTLPSELNEDEIKTIILMHLFPDGPSTDMELNESGLAEFVSDSKLEELWDADLAKFAQRWADQCLEGLDECRNTVDFNVIQRVGVNEIYRAEPKPSLVRIIQRWYIEDIFTNPGLWRGSYEENKRVFGYSRIGCGKLIRSLNLRIQLTLVCNYGPA